MEEWFDWGGEDASFEDQTDWYNNGDTSVGTDYTGYTPGYENPNIDTDWGGYQDWGDYGGWGSNSDSFNPITGGEDALQLSNPSYNYSGSGTTDKSFLDSINPTLANLFNNPTAMGMTGKGIAALFEGYQNKKKADAMQKLASSSALDPFGSQRGFYQQQAQQAVTNPYDSPIVKAQITQLQNAQNIKDAAAGRRSNSLTSSPAVMAQMAQIAQAYQNQMAQQGGSNIAPSSGLASILQSGSNADTNGYLSPLMSLLGNYTQAQKNAAAMG